MTFFTTTLSEWLMLRQHDFFPVVPFDADTEKLMPFNLSNSNSTLTPGIINNTALFNDYINQQLQLAGARYGYGGYNELRKIYRHLPQYNDAPGLEPRMLHLGIDIWGEAGTPVMAPLGGMVHSFAFNNQPGDYGATIILSHQLDGRQFFTLYGHLAIKNVMGIKEGNYIVPGEELGQFGTMDENGHWPPHLHFQVIEDIGLNMGNYPGVCRYSERERWLANCPNPEVILQMEHFIGQKK